MAYTGTTAPAQSGLGRRRGTACRNV